MSTVWAREGVLMRRFLQIVRWGWDIARGRRRGAFAVIDTGNKKIKVLWSEGMSIEEIKPGLDWMLEDAVNQDAIEVRRQG